MKTGIRSYGPGKHHTIVGSYAYEMTLDGGADQEASDDAGRWGGFVTVDDATRERIREIAEEERRGGMVLTPEEEDQLDRSVAIIFFERSDGIVDTYWYEDMAEAKEDWERLEGDFTEDSETDEEDLDEEEVEEEEDE